MRLLFQSDFSNEENGTIVFYKGFLAYFQAVGEYQISTPLRRAETNNTSLMAGGGLTSRVTERASVPACTSETATVLDLDPPGPLDICIWSPLAHC